MINNPNTKQTNNKTTGFVLANGINMYYEIHGANNINAPIIVLIGGLSRDHTIWDGIVDLLSACLRVLVYDNRGTGQTEYAAQPPYTPRLLSDDLASLLDALGITESVYVVGHSLGGFVAQYLAAIYPAKVRGLLLCSTCIKQPDAAKNYLTKRLFDIDNGVSSDSALLAVLPLLFSQEFLTEDRIKDILNATKTNPYPQSVQSLRAQIVACLAHDSSAVIDKIQAPTLIITGANDAIITPMLCEEMQTHIAGSSVRIIEGAAHMIQIEQPDAMCAIIKEFILANEN